MSTIMYKDIVYGGGGGGSSDVIPNPAGTPLFDLNTVEINNIVYNIPGSGGGGTDDYDDLTNKPQINGVTLSGNKTAANLGIIITKTQAEYDALPLEEKIDPNKVYYISDASGSGGSGATVMSELNDVQISNLSDGQILKYDNSIHKWKNVNEYSYTLPTASANTLGGIKIGDRLSIDANGVLSANVQTYTLPAASVNTLGGIKVGDRLSIDLDGKLSAVDQSYSLPIADANTLGGIKVGQNLNINQNGVLSAVSGVNNITDLSDVNISNCAHKEILQYNAINSKWENTFPIGTTSDYGFVRLSTSGGLKTDFSDMLSIDCGSGLDIDFSTNKLYVDIKSNNLNSYSPEEYTFTAPVSNGDAVSFIIDLEKDNMTHVYPSVSLKGKTIINQGILVFAYDANDNQYRNIVVQTQVTNTVNSSNKEVYRIHCIFYNTSGATITKLRLYLSYSYI